MNNKIEILEQINIELEFIEKYLKYINDCKITKIEKLIDEFKKGE